MLSKWNATAGAVCLVIGSLGQLAQHLVTPLPLGEATGAEQVAAAAAHPAAMGWATAFDLPLLLIIPGVLWIGWAAGGGRSALAAVGTGLAFLGMLGATYLTAGDVVVGEAAALRNPSAAGALVDRYVGSAVLDGTLVGLLLGQVLGFALLGIALRRARSVPAWSAIGLGVFPLLDTVGHLTDQLLVTSAAYVVALVCVLPVVAAVLGSAGAVREETAPVRAEAS
jgi:hypothetical protein